MLAGTPFTDTFNFIINDTGTGSGSVTTEVSLPGLGGVTDTDLVSVFINGVLATHTVNTPQTSQRSATNVPIAFGVLNTLIISNGPSRGQGHYAGTAEFTPNAVPELATWAMMLAGFGGIGFQMRRKRTSVMQQIA